MSPSDNPLVRLPEYGQSPWYDNIHRGLIESGELRRLIAEDGLRGITSNPTIFEKAIAGGDDYDAPIRATLRQHPGIDARGLFYQLAIDDIRAAADALLPVHAATDGRDGMVSLEVSPDLADDTEATVREARELHARVDRRNLMIKVPATRAGVEAVRQLTADGININVTLLFAVERYAEVAEAYLQGLEERINKGLPIDAVASVASFFVSRVDSALDPVLAERRAEWCGRAAIANAKLAYRHFHAIFAGPRWAALSAAGAQPQRLLWASTGTKNPDYSDVLYVEALIGPDTVNTLPPATWNAFRGHGRTATTLTEDHDGARALIDGLAELGIDLTAVTGQLERDGVAAFAHSFTTLLQAIEAKTAALEVSA